jgi:hypothetical protein
MQVHHQRFCVGITQEQYYASASERFTTRLAMLAGGGLMPSSASQQLF